MFAAYFFQALTQPFIKWYSPTVYGFWLLLPGLVVSLLFLLLAGPLVLIFTLFRAHAGYLHFWSAFGRHYSSYCNSWGLEHMVWAPWWRVPITLYLDDTVSVINIECRSTLKEAIPSSTSWWLQKSKIQKKTGVIYSYKCGRIECDEEYIGESSRTFWERFKEHQEAPSAIYDHFNTTGHIVTIDNLSIVGREDQNLNRAIKETLYIRVNNPPLNRNIGKYHLPHIWDEVLFNTSELKLN